MGHWGQLGVIIPRTGCEAAERSSLAGTDPLTLHKCLLGSLPLGTLANITVPSAQHPP